MPRRQLQQKTVLIVGEGFCDTAFLKHLKSVYDFRYSGVRITIKNAQGKGANNVIDTAIKIRQRIAYDVIGVLYDIDVPQRQTLSGKPDRQNFSQLQQNHSWKVCCSRY